MGPAYRRIARLGGGGERRGRGGPLDARSQPLDRPGDEEIKADRRGERAADDDRGEGGRPLHPQAVGDLQRHHRDRPVGQIDRIGKLAQEGVPPPAALEEEQEGQGGEEQHEDQSRTRRLDQRQAGRSGGERQGENGDDDLP